MFDSPWFWIWLAGFVPLSPFVFFAWVLGCQLTGDSTDAVWRIKQCLLITAGCFFFIWLWPLGIIAMFLGEGFQKRKTAKRNKIYAYKKATVPNYWEEAYIRNSKVFEGARVRILDWEIEPGMTRVSSWDTKLITKTRFFKRFRQAVFLWPTNDLELILKNK